MVGIDTTHAETTQDFTQRLTTERAHIQKAASSYQDPRCSVALANDADLFHQSITLASNYPDVELLVIVGIGGSNLGTQALLKARYGEAYRQNTLFLDTVDPDDTADALRVLENALSARKRVLVNIISKSGGTAETLANAKLVIGLLEKHEQPLETCVVATTDAGSALDAFAQSHNIPTLNIPKRVGGRFSVFSPVGVFPLAVLGVDVQGLLTGAKQALNDTLEGTDHAAALAVAQYEHALNKKNIVDFFVFAKRLDSIGAWYRQLLAESIGKNENVGITPTTSIGSTDLHSVAQLHFAGPKDKFFLLITLTDRTPVSSQESVLDEVSPAIQGVSHNTLYDAIYQGTKQAFINEQLPFAEITLTNANEQELGYLLQTLMLQVMYLGALFDVNPFDQPAVELYKKETRDVLSR